MPGPPHRSPRWWSPACRPIRSPSPASRRPRPASAAPSIGRLGRSRHTLILFESPHRILASLEDALAELGDRPAAIARELTKLHEETIRGSLGALVEAVRARSGAGAGIKGECVLVVGRGQARDSVEATP